MRARRPAAAGTRAAAVFAEAAGSQRARREGRQGILPYVLEAAQRDDVTARAGLPLVVETMRALGLDEVAREQLPKPVRERGFSPEQSSRRS